MFLYTLLFTLQDKDPLKNKYIDMFYIWFAFVKRNAGLKSTDTVCILVDKRTLDVLNSNDTLDSLLGEHSFQFRLQLITVPATLSEGIAQRYTILSHDIHLFLDLDILVQNPIHLCLNYFQDPCWFACMPEGVLLHPDYGGQLLVPCDSYSKLPGLTAGWFCFTPCKYVAEMFCKMQLDILKNKDTPFYTIDQPYFNKAIIDLQESKLPIKLYYLSKKFYATNIQYNINYLNSNRIFWNYCGEPGNDTFHFQKMLREICFSYISTKPESAAAQGEQYPLQESSTVLPS